MTSQRASQRTAKEDLESKSLKPQQIPAQKLGVYLYLSANDYHIMSILCLFGTCKNPKCLDTIYIQSMKYEQTKCDLVC